MFHLFNVRLTHKVLDASLWLLDARANWVLPLLLVSVLFSTVGGRKGRLALLLAVITVAVTDPYVCRVLKPLIGRVRPCHVVEGARVLVGCTDSPSFPSAHAANAFGVAFVFAWFSRRSGVLYLMTAAVVAYSRVYVGVHYPLDVLAGAMVGIACGSLVVGVAASISDRMLRMNHG